MRDTTTRLGLALGLLILPPHKAPAQPPEAPASNPVRERYTKPEFMKHLKGVEVAMPRAWVFETGRNEWHKHDAWPTSGAWVR